MRVGLFTDAYLPQIGGVSTASHLIKTKLIERGHEAYVITGADPKAEEEENVIRIPSYPFVSAKRVASEFAPFKMKEIHGLNLDLCHSQTEFSLGSISRRIARKAQIPLIHTYHTLYEDWIESQPGPAFLGKISIGYVKAQSIKHCSYAEKVIVPTAKTETLLRDYGIETPITILPTGIQVETFREARLDTENRKQLRKQLGIPEDAFVVLYLGRISNEKAIDQVMNYMPKLMDRHSNLYYVLVGSGPSLNEGKAKAKEMGLADRILFTGQVKLSQVAKYYAIADSFASASQSETQGLTYIEAMAVGLPLMAYPDPCLDGVLKNQVNGFVFTDEEEFARGLESLMSDFQSYEKISENAIKTAEEFSSEKFMDTLLDLYENVLENFDPSLRTRG